MTDGLSKKLRDFLLSYVDSIEQLEVLLLLAARPAAAFTTVEVSDELRTAPSSAANRLARLRDHGLVDVLPGDRHRLRSDPDLTDTLRQLAEAYRERRVTVVTLIYSKPSDVVRVFTNAFLLKKDPKDG